MDTIYKEKTNFLTTEEHRQAVEFFYGKEASWWYISQSNLHDQTRFWFHKLDDHPLFGDVAVKRIRDMYPDLGPLERVYGNGQTSFQSGDWHIDWHKGTTFLWYLNTMEPNWGGRTLFRHDDREYGYTPQANSIIHFPANVLHMAEAPTADFPLLRVSVAWKFE